MPICYCVRRPTLDKPLTIQSDRTLLLDVHSPSASECRSDISKFADLIKSPEHIHTYMISQLSLWNAISTGMSGHEIIHILEKWSRYDIDSRVIFFIEDQSSRYGDFILEEFDDENLILKVRRPVFAMQLKADRSLDNLIAPHDQTSFLVKRFDRGTLKAVLVKQGFPVADMIPLKSGAPLEISLKPSFKPRDYQIDAVDAFISDGKPGTGFGTIVLPCGSGKTIVAIMAMARLGRKTLILCPNVTSVRQWIREILDKTTLTEKDVGEYTGNAKEIRSVTVSTYQVLTWRPDAEGPYPHFSIFREEDWGFIIYDEVHVLPAPVFRVTAELQALHRLGLTATLVREDGKEDQVFSLVGPKRFDTPWSELADNGFIATAYCHEIRLSLPEEDEVKYAVATSHQKHIIASTNPKKLEAAARIIAEHPDDPTLIIGQYIEQLRYFHDSFGYPIITGSTSNAKREELYQAFREKKIRVLIVSKVANYAVDLPDASVAIQISGTFGSRQEEAQRLGRILRPKDRDSHFYSLITEYTVEETYALNRQKFLAEQGYSYTIVRW